MSDPGFVDRGHGFTCGLCEWGRAGEQIRSRAEYETHVAECHPSAASHERHEHDERIEIRRNDDGTIDEVILYVGGRCVFHLEQLDDDAWWFGLGTDTEGFDIYRHKTKVHVWPQDSAKEGPR